MSSISLRLAVSLSLFILLFSTDTNARTAQSTTLRLPERCTNCALVQDETAHPSIWIQSGRIAEALDRLFPGEVSFLPCDTGNYLCAKRAQMAVAVPRMCIPFNVGDVWTVQGVTTKVVWVRPSHYTKLPGDDRKALLATEGDSSTVYYYDETYGLTLVISDSTGRTDYAALAANGDLSDLNISSVQKRFPAIIKDIHVPTPSGGCIGKRPPPWAYH